MAKKDLIGRTGSHRLTQVAGGRPVSPTAWLVDEVLARVAAGGTLKRISVDPAMPLRRTFLAWLDADPDLRERYRNALKVRAESHVDEALDIADGADPRTANLARLQVDTRKWLAGKLDPARYSERMEIEQTTTIKEERLPRLELARRVAFIFADVEDAVMADPLLDKPER
jgi:hypothetical protein